LAGYITPTTTLRTHVFSPYIPLDQMIMEQAVRICSTKVERVNQKVTLQCVCVCVYIYIYITFFIFNRNNNSSI
jgi:glutamate formiminotransferase